VHNFQATAEVPHQTARSSHAARRSVTGTVSLEADLKGINMSRIVRSFYEHKDDIFTGEWMGQGAVFLSAQC